jgi:uncharacterized protein YciI
MRILYFYFMKDAPDQVRGAAARHAAYWRDLALREYLGGPFADRLGGLITFETDSRDEAERFVANDPFALEQLIDLHWVREWAVD